MAVNKRNRSTRKSATATPHPSPTGAPVQYWNPHVKEAMDGRMESFIPEHPPSEKARIYEVLHSLNLRYDQIVMDYERLKELKVLKSETIKEFQVILEETRACSNDDVMDIMSIWEDQDGYRLGILRRQMWWKQTGPDDIYIEKEQLKERLKMLDAEIAKVKRKKQKSGKKSLN